MSPKTEHAKKQWDVFVSYASEDRNVVAKPLVQMLRSLGLSVWYDEDVLELGDSIRKTIDEGLRHCRYGVVVLSSHFFGKHYPERELAGLEQREIDGEKVVLPIWYGVSEADVRDYSPSLAGRKAGRWEEGIETVAWKIFQVVRSELVQNAMAEFDQLDWKSEKIPEVHNGHELIRVLCGTCGLFVGRDPVENKEEAEILSGFLRNLEHSIDVLGGMEIHDQVEAEVELTGMLQDLREAGWKVFGRRARRSMKSGDEIDELWSVVVVTRSGTESIYWQPDDLILAYRPDKE